MVLNPGGADRTRRAPIPSSTAAPVRDLQTVLPALHQRADYLQVVTEDGSVGVKAVLHQELQQPVGQHLVSGVALATGRGRVRTQRLGTRTDLDTSEPWAWPRWSRTEP